MYDRELYIKLWRTIGMAQLARASHPKSSVHRCLFRTGAQVFLEENKNRPSSATNRITNL